MERINTNAFIDPAIGNTATSGQSYTGIDKICEVFNKKYEGHLPPTGCWVLTDQSDGTKYLKLWGEDTNLNLDIDLTTDIVTMPDGSKIEASVLISQYEIVPTQTATSEPTFEPTATLTKKSTPTNTPVNLEPTVKSPLKKVAAISAGVAALLGFGGGILADLRRRKRRIEDRGKAKNFKEGTFVKADPNLRMRTRSNSQPVQPDSPPDSSGQTSFEDLESLHKISGSSKEIIDGKFK